MSEKGHIKCYKFEILPTDLQKEFLNMHFGCTRLIYNKALAEVKERMEADRKLKEAFEADPANEGKKYENTTPYPASQFSYNREPYSEDGFGSAAYYRKNIKNDNGELFLQEVDSIALNYAIQHLANAYSSWFNKKLIDAKEPKFKSRWGHQSYTTKRSAKGDKYDLMDGTIKFDCDNQMILLPKFNKEWKDKGKPGWIRVIMHRDIRIPNNPCYIQTVTLSKDPDEKYYVSILCYYKDNPYPELPQTKKSTGISFGIKNDIVITSDNKRYTYDKDKINRIETHINDLNSKLSRMIGAKKGERPSKNYLKMRKKIEKLRSHKNRILKYNSHIITKDIVANYDNIYIRDYQAKKNIEQSKAQRSDMTDEQISELNKMASNANIGNIKALIQTKAKIYNRSSMLIDSDFPCNSICSKCGEKVTNTHKDVMICPYCGSEIDAKLNAAKNIFVEGLSISDKVEYEKAIKEKKLNISKRKNALSFKICEVIKEYNEKNDNKPLKISKSKVNSAASYMANKPDFTDEEIVALLKEMVDDKKRKYV